MLTHFLFRFFLTFLGVETTGAAAQPVVQVEKVDSARVAQVRLAETLGTADAIHSVTAKRNQVTFTITKDKAVLAIVATTRRGEVVALSIEPAAASSEVGGGLTWLADELESITAITRLVADEDGAVTITTNDGRRYMAIPGRGSGGNEAVSSRWAAEWSRR